MADDYIRKADAKDALQEKVFHNLTDEFYGAMQVIDELPSADVTPVVHAYWRDTGSGQECSACKEIQYGYDTGRYFCANCGAKMDGEE